MPRDAARLLVVRPDGAPPLEDLHVTDLAGLLKAGDVLVFNDTKVIPARLYGRREREGGEGASIEATLHQRIDGSRWKAFVKPAKRVKPGDLIRFGGKGEACYLATLDATVEKKGEDGEVTLAFSFTGPFLDENIALYGEMPLPPYIAGRRAVDERDSVDYQTVYARDRGRGGRADRRAALHAKPHASLASDSRGDGIRHPACGRRHLPAGQGGRYGRSSHARGMGRDQPPCRRPAERGARRRRTHRGGRHHRGAACWKVPPREDGTIQAFSGATNIFIHPGYRFRGVDVLMTNFHLPRSTLFMLVSAFCGLDCMKAAYAHAIEKGYRFYSYGDASLLFPARHE